METLLLRVMKIELVINEAILVTLQEADGAAISYQAGQFLTFIINFHGTELRRSYSICSTPGIDHDLVVLVKRVENGAVSRFLVDRLAAGDLLTALPPAGRFILSTDSNNNRSLFFFAAGSGISPVFAIVKKLLKEEPRARAILLYQNRNEASIIFKRDLDILQEQSGHRLVVIHLLSNPLDHGHPPRRLNNTLLEQLVSGYLDTAGGHEFYLCGPPAFMRMIQFVLKKMGIREDQIRKESFITEAPRAVPFVLESTPRDVSVKWKDKVFRFSVSYPETILQAALKNNIQLPYSCRAGRCSSCVMSCVTGTVKLGVNEVLTAKDLAEGLVLTCVGYDASDLVLQL